MKENSLYGLIYNYLLIRIHYGFYPKGGYLPSILELSNLFGVSTMVIRTAFKLLRENGYLSYETTERPVVLYDFENPKQAFPEQLLIQGDDFEDFHRTFDLIFPSIYFCGLSICDNRDLEELRLILDRSADAWDSPLVDFLAHLAKRLQNSLVTDLYYDVTLFSYPTYLDYLAKDKARWKRHHEVLNKKLLEILALKERGNTAALQTIVNQAYPPMDWQPVLDSGKERNSPYRWGKSQVCLNTAGEIVSRICKGVYPVDTFLPSPRILSEELSVSLITVRRSIVLLNDLGVAESVNGRGTKVIPPERGVHKVNWSSPVIRKNTLLYLESLYMLAITCRRLAAFLFPLISPEEKATLKERICFIKGQSNAGHANTLCLQALISASNLLSLREVYDKLFSFIVWGQPLFYLKPHLQLDQYTDLLTESLDSNDAMQFGSALEQAYFATFRSSQSKAITVGIEEAERLILPY
ncbi:GntR family transcriptional regulator [Ruminococcus sp. OA3]|uniref:GntR family transcriptional regulator n=1 Tax=Ruminococcus sp. OA3 TaxID=2914164 RepID=UPI001F06AE84|nr:GntR family transcriptional regulator [Ruminococcus sp. OA3]